MALAFELAGTDAPLAIDWDRIDIVSERPGSPVSAAPAPAPRSGPPPPTPPPASVTDELVSHAWSGRAWQDSGTEVEPSSPLPDAEVRRLAAASRSVPSVNLRGLDRHTAAAQLRDFVVLARHADVSIIQVITGKGVDSSGAPVLRPLLGRWLGDRVGVDVRGWCYERDAEGEWGAALVVLRRR